MKQPGEERHYCHPFALMVPSAERRRENPGLTFVVPNAERERERERERGGREGERERWRLRPRLVFHSRPSRSYTRYMRTCVPCKYGRIARRVARISEEAGEEAMDGRT